MTDQPVNPVTLGTSSKTYTFSDLKAGYDYVFEVCIDPFVYGCIGGGDLQ